LQRHLHRQFGAASFGMRSSHVISVTRQAITNDLGIDLRTPRLRVLILLEHDDAGALAHDEAFAILVIGPARLLGAVVIRRVERSGLGKAGDPRRVDRVLVAPANLAYASASF